MTTYIALLRGINVGGHKPIAMAALRNLATELGCADPCTLLQSGNLMFRATRKTPAQWERLLEPAVEQRLGVQADVFVRTADEWKGIVTDNPFRQEAERDPGHLLVVFMKDAPDAKDVKALQAKIAGREIVRARGRHAYVVYPDGVGRSRLTNTLIEKTLGTRGTARNWNTVLKLDARAGVE